MPIKKQPDHIGFVLGELVGKKNWDSRFELHRVFSFWTEIVGDEVAAQACPHKMHGTVLWVEVSNSVWLQQLQYLKMAFVENINARFTDVALTDIRFSLKPHREESADKTPAPPKVGPAPSKVDRAQFAKTVSEISDPELRAAMQRCWEALYHYKDR